MTAARDARTVLQRLPDFSAMIPITDQEFTLFQRLVYKEAGIFLSEAKRALLVSRLAGRLRALQISTFGAYYRHVTADESGEELTRMLDCISTNETRFFREPKQFELIERKVLPEIVAQAESGKRPRKLRVWSAACSTGEEPFSIAMVLLHHLPPETGFTHEILASDLSTRVLSSAQSALWRIEKASEIPTHYLKAFMLKGTGSREGVMKADDQLRSLIHFQRLNLNDEAYPVTGSFDLIFCRNVLIYFSAESKRRVIHKLLGHLAPGGHFFVGHAESLHGVSDRVRTVIPTVYTVGEAGRPKSALAMSST